MLYLEVKAGHGVVIGDGNCRLHFASISNISDEFVVQLHGGWPASINDTSPIGKEPTTLKNSDRMLIGDNVVIGFKHGQGGRVRMGIEAPRSVSFQLYKSWKIRGDPHGP